MLAVRFLPGAHFHENFQWTIALDMLGDMRKLPALPRYAGAPATMTCHIFAYADSLDPRTNRNVRQLLGGANSPMRAAGQKARPKLSLIILPGHSKHSTFLICRSDMTISYGFCTPINKHYQCDSFYADTCVRSRSNLLCIQHRLSRLFSPTVLLSGANLGSCY